MNRKLLALATLLAACWSLPAAAQDGERKPDELFTSLDKNNDGKLTADEISEAQRPYFERLVRSGDKNTDGVLTKEEFLAAMRQDDRPVNNPNPGGADRPDGRRPQFNPGQMFERFDANKDGKLTLDELPEEAKRFMQPMFERLGKQELTREDLERAGQQFGGGQGRPGAELIRRMDQNGDGKISLSEVPEQARERLKPIFDRLGQDEIDVGQLAERLADAGRPGDNPGQPRPGQPEPGRRPMPEGGRPGAAPGEFRGPTFLRVLDTDGDGRLSKDELAKAADKFAELDQNKDGQLDPPELMGFPPGGPEGRASQFGRPGEGRPGAPGRPGDRRPADGRRPEGDSRPEGRPRRPESDQPQTRRPEQPQGKPDQPQAQRGARADGDAIFTRLDADSDGAISESEAPQKIKDNFSRLDANGDGKLAQDELGSLRDKLAGRTKTAK